MPKKAIDYSNTVIYKIVCNDLNITDCYVGHTTDFRKRKAHHKCNAINKKILKVYNFINENGGWDNWQMIMVEKIECVDNLEATARERYWFETLGATLNGNVPNRTQIERITDNHTQILEKAKEYYEKNKEIHLQKAKEYRDKNKEKIKKYQKQYNEEKKHKKAMENLETNATV